MKLIEFLVSRGHEGWLWPNGITKAAVMLGGGAVSFFYNDNLPPALSETLISPRYFRDNECVTREQYEAALASSKPEWGGEGLPPVGCECEYKDTNTGEWVPVEIKYSSRQIVVFSGRIRFRESSVEISKDVVIDNPQFRPLRSEEDKRRDDAVKALREIIGGPGGPYAQVKAGEIYDAIKSGKIAIE